MLHHGACIPARRAFTLRTGLVKELAKAHCLTRPSLARVIARGATRAKYHSGTVSSSTGASIDQLVKQIRSSVDAKAGGLDSVLVLLSPAYAKHARDQDLPLAIAAQLGRDAALGRSLTSITAVVDGLHNASNQDGEGLAYVVQQDSTTKATTKSEALRSSAQRPGALSFVVTQASKQQDWHLQLPLAQTIFSTGKPSTLVRRTHSIEADGSSIVTDEEYLESVSYQLQPERALDALQISFPLVQLTSYRTVGQSMGNIIRTVSTYETNKEEPASRNLETAVSAYFAALDASPEPVNVWALVIPKSVLLTGEIDKLARNLVMEDSNLQHGWRASYQAEGTNDGSIFTQLLQGRARLVKVLSGGGGWGKKAGLLSLDPDLEYSTRELRDDYGWQFDFEQADDSDTQASVGRQIDRALGASVEEGDGIVFFIAPVKARSSITSLPIPLGARTISLGVAEAKADAVTAERVRDSGSDHQVDFLGVSSHTGLGLRIMEHGRLVNKTKLEVPGLQLAISSTS